MELSKQQNVTPNHPSSRRPEAGGPREDQKTAPEISVSPSNGFKDLKVWQKSMSLVQKIYEVTRFFPKEETYGLTCQIKRAAVSISSNIAEGHRRWHPAEFKQHLNIALGSTAELETQLILAAEIGYLNPKASEALCGQINEICRMLVGLAKKL